MRANRRRDRSERRRSPLAEAIALALIGAFAFFAIAFVCIAAQEDK